MCFLCMFDWFFLSIVWSISYILLARVHGRIHSFLLLLSFFWFCFFYG